MKKNIKWIALGCLIGILLTVLIGYIVLDKKNNPIKENDEKQDEIIIEENKEENNKEDETEIIEDIKNEKEIVDIIKNSDGELRVTDITYEKGKYLVEAKLIKPYIISKQEFEKMIEDGYIYIGGTKYIYEANDNKVDHEKFKHWIYAEEKYYWPEKTDNGYYFVYEIGGYCSPLSYVEKENINIYLDEDTKVEHILIGEDYEGRIKTLKEEADYVEDYLIRYSDEDGMYLFNDHF